MTPLPEGRFWLETPLNPDIGNAGVGFTFARRSTVSLSNAWGEVRQGRDETATCYNTGHFDPFGDTGLGAAGNLTVKPLAMPNRGATQFAHFTPPGVAGGLYGSLRQMAIRRAPSSV